LTAIEQTLSFPDMPKFQLPTEVELLWLYSMMLLVPMPMAVEEKIVTPYVPIIPYPLLGPIFHV
jgi:hypothetical protein